MNDPVAALWHDVHPYQLIPLRTVRLVVLVRSFVGLLRKHLLDLFVAEVDLVHMVPAQLERHVFVVAVRRDEDLGVPDKALRGSEVCDLVIQVSAIVARPCCCTASCRRQEEAYQSQGPLGVVVPDLDGCTFLLGERRACQPRVSAGCTDSSPSDRGGAN